MKIPSSKRWIYFTFSWFEYLATTKLAFHIRQSWEAQQDSTSSTTGLWKITVLPPYYHHILEASKPGDIDWNETFFEGTKGMVVKYGK